MTRRKPRVRLSLPLSLGIVVAIVAQLVPLTGVAAAAADDQRLLARIPAPIAGTCQVAAINPTTYPGENARMACQPQGLTLAIYQQFDSVAAMDTVFDRELGYIQAPGTDCKSGPSQHGYTINDVPAGRMACFELFGKAAFEWTDERLGVLTTIIGTGLDYGAVWQSWLNAGPNPGPDDPGATPGGPTPGPVASPIISSPGPVASGSLGGVASPPSQGQAVIYHLQFATNIEAERGLPVGLGDTFPVGTKVILAMLGWQRIQPGTELGIKLYLEDRFIGEAKRTVQNPRNAGFVVPFSSQDGFPAGSYKAEVTYNGLPDEIASFCVVDVGTGTTDPCPGPSGAPGTPPTPSAPPIGTTPGPDLGPIDYADPATVLVVTRSSVLRARMGAQADAVLAAAATVGTVQDLDAQLGTAPAVDPAASVAAVKTLLRGGTYRYLLILGNDDAIPYAQLPNPLAAEEREDLDPWQLPSDVIASDDPYGDVDGDQLGIPDIGVARLPSSEDAQLLLTQLGTVITPANGGFALINSQRRSQAGAVAGLMGAAVSVDRYFVPPTGPDELPATNKGTARYLYVLLHGIGTTTDEWSGDVQSWSPIDTQDPFSAEWQVGVGAQTEGMTIPYASAAGAVVNVGACYGAWTLDTIQEPRQKNASNNLALSFLKSGTRAFIADTHLSYTTGSVPGHPVLIGRTGFEIAMWQGITGGASPIDAFLSAKQTLGRMTLDLIAQSGSSSVGDAINLNTKTIHHMVYLGRP